MLLVFIVIKNNLELKVDFLGIVYLLIECIWVGMGKECPSLVYLFDWYSPSFRWTAWIRPVSVDWFVAFLYRTYKCTQRLFSCIHASMRPCAHETIDHEPAGGYTLQELVKVKLCIVYKNLKDWRLRCGRLAAHFFSVDIFHYTGRVLPRISRPSCVQQRRMASQMYIALTLLSCCCQAAEGGRISVE